MPARIHGASHIVPAVWRRRAGVALPVAIGALVLLAMLAAGAALAVRGEGRAGDASLAAVRARAAAEGALALELASWDHARDGAVAVGGADSAVRAVGGVQVRVRVARTTRDGWTAEAVARAPTGLAGLEAWAERRARVDLRAAPLVAHALGAITATGEVRLEDGAAVSGADDPPDGWNGCAPSVDTLAVAVPDASLVVASSGVTVEGGVGAVAAASTAATYMDFGDASWAALAARADVSLAGHTVASPNPEASAGRCMLATPSWGEPLRGAGALAECTGSFALVYADGASPMRIEGPARAQGVLLVDGDVELAGDVRFAGVVVATGAVRLAGNVRVLGALLARGPVTVGDGARVAFSRCAVRAALRGVARTVPLARRAWSH